MEKRIRFGRWESATLLINLVCTKIFLYYNRMTVEDAGTAGWLLSVFSSFFALIMFIVLISLYKRFGDSDILDVAEAGGGKTLKILTGTIISASLFYLTVIVLRKFSEDMKIVSLSVSPLSYVMFFFIAGMAIASFFGIEAILRYHAIVVPVIVLGYILILLGVIPKMDVSNMLPVLGTGIEDIIKKGFIRSSIYGELIVLFLLPPFLGSYSKVKSTGFIALAFSAFFLIAGSLVYILSIPYPVSLEPFLPVYNMTREISLGRFFQRIEAIFVFIWAMAALMYLTATFYFMVHTFAKTAGLKHTRPLILPFALIVFSAAFIPENLVAVIKLEANTTNKYAWLVTFVLTGAILALAALRKRSRKERS
ncbi:MAG: endospore germination permease [Clostridiaceae bacterium]|jgi:spore germination protein (amino acid permease)|nr:endospore germination permease [Clostridiaceae bacterium]